MWNEDSSLRRRIVNRNGTSVEVEGKGRDKKERRGYRRGKEGRRGRIIKG